VSSFTTSNIVESLTGSTSIRIAATANVNLSNSTAGSVDVWVLTSTLP